MNRVFSFFFAMPGRCLLLMTFFVFAYICKGQIPDKSPSNPLRKSNTIENGKPKLVRALGSKYGNVGCELEDRTGKLWFSTGGEGVFCYNGKSFTQFTEKDGLPDNSVTTIIEDKEGNILFGTKSGVSSYDGKYFSPLTKNDDPSKEYICSLLQDRNGNLWLGTMTNGVFRYDGKTFTNFLNGSSEPGVSGSRKQVILDMLQDNKGNIWFCSWSGGGVWRYDGKYFKNFVPSPEYYSSNQDGRSFGTTEPKMSPGYLPKTIGYQPKEYIHDDMIFSATEDRAGNLWFATRNHGVCRYDGQFFTGFTAQQGFVSKGVYAVREDKKGNIWLATNANGVYRYDGKSFGNYTTRDGLVNNSVFSILEDSVGNLWFGTRGFGLSRFNGKSFETCSGD